MVSAKRVGVRKVRCAGCCEPARQVKAAGSKRRKWGGPSSRVSRDLERSATPRPRSRAAPAALRRSPRRSVLPLRRRAGRSRARLARTRECPRIGLALPVGSQTDARGRRGRPAPEGQARPWWSHSEAPIPSSCRRVLHRAEKGTSVSILRAAVPRSRSVLAPRLPQGFLSRRGKKAERRGSHTSRPS